MNQWRWTEHDEEHLKFMKQRTLERYHAQRAKLSDEYQRLLDHGIEQGYLSLPGTGKRATVLRWAYESWCMAQAKPLIQILPLSNKHLVRVKLSLETMKPYGAMNVHCPDLDLDDKDFHRMMLLCHEYSFTNGHVTLRQVSKEKADEVARELLAFYERSYQSYMQTIEG